MYVQHFYSGSRLNVACLGGNDDATLKPVLRKPPTLPALGGRGVSAASEKQRSLLCPPPPSE